MGCAQNGGEAWILGSRKAWINDAGPVEIEFQVVPDVGALAASTHGGEEGGCIEKCETRDEGGA